MNDYGKSNGKLSQVRTRDGKMLQNGKIMYYIKYVNIYIRLGQKGVNFGNSLMASGVYCMGSKDEDVVKYF